MVNQPYRIPEYRIPERKEEEQLPEMIPEPVDAEPLRLSDAKRKSDEGTDAHELVREYANVRRAASKPHEAVRILRTILVQVSAKSISLGQSSTFQWHVLCRLNSPLSTTCKFELYCSFDSKVNHLAKHMKIQFYRRVLSLSVTAAWLFMHNFKERYMTRDAMILESCYWHKLIWASEILQQYSLQQATRQSSCTCLRILLPEFWSSRCRDHITDACLIYSIELLT